MQTLPTINHDHRITVNFTLTVLLVLLFAWAKSTFAAGSISVASFKGNYAFYIAGTRGHAKLPVYVLGVLSFNGDGTGRATTQWNLPGETFKERQTAARDWHFSYEMDEQGIGLIQGDAVADIYFVPTRTRPRGHKTPLVLEMKGMSGRLETSGGNVVTGTAKRLPRHARFDVGSLDGVYAGIGIGEGGRQVTSVGYITNNGDGTGQEHSLWNLPDPLHAFERQLALLPTPSFTYTIDPTGIGSGRFATPNGEEFNNLFVVTKARRVHGKYLATEMFVVQSEPDPQGGDVISGHVSRLYDR